MDDQNLEVIESADQLVGWRMQHIREWKDGFKRVIVIKEHEGREVLIPAGIVENLMLRSASEKGCCG